MTPSPSDVKAVLLTGVTGVGKSTVADAIGRVRRGRGETPALSETQGDVADFSVVNDRPPEQVADELISRCFASPRQYR